MKMVNPKENKFNAIQELINYVVSGSLKNIINFIENDKNITLNAENIIFVMVLDI